MRSYDFDMNQSVFSLSPVSCMQSGPSRHVLTNDMFVGRGTTDAVQICTRMPRLSVRDGEGEKEKLTDTTVTTGNNDGLALEVDNERHFV